MGRLCETFNAVEDGRQLMSDNSVLDLIVDMRDGYPKKCDYCKQTRPAHELVPDEAGTWSCAHCWERWNRENKE